MIFFQRRGVVAILGVREFFDLVTRETTGNSKEEQESTLAVVVEAAGSRIMVAHF